MFKLHIFIALVLVSFLFCAYRLFFLFFFFFVEGWRVLEGSGRDLLPCVCAVTWQAWVGGAGRELPEPQQSFASHWSTALWQGTTHTHTRAHTSHTVSVLHTGRACVCMGAYVCVFVRKKLEGEGVNAFSFIVWCCVHRYLCTPSILDSGHHRFICVTKCF